MDGVGSSVVPRRKIAFVTLMTLAAVGLGIGTVVLYGWAVAWVPPALIAGLVWERWDDDF